MWILYVILALIVLFLIVIVCRALAFKPKPETPAEPEEVSFDRDGAVKALAALVSCRTVYAAYHTLPLYVIERGCEVLSFFPARNSSAKNIIHFQCEQCTDADMNTMQITGHATI